MKDVIKRTMPRHTCHARGCNVSVKPELLMCGAHWHLVPQNIQRAVYRAYRPGQCDDKNPSSSWHTAADAAIGYVAALDGQAMRVKEVTALSGFGFETSTDAYGNLTVKLAALKALA